MLEIPESTRLSDQLMETVNGKTIKNVIANQSPHKFAWFSGDPDEYRNLLSGKSVTGSAAYGGMAELRIESYKMVFCDGTNVRFLQPGAPLPQKHQLLMEFDDLSVIFCSVQMYGGMLLMDINAEEGYYKSSKHRLNPLDQAFDEAYFTLLMDEVKPSLSIKAFLATQQRIPGLGNGVLQDILFNAKVHPRRKLESLTESQRHAVFQSVKQTILEMTQKGGRDTEKDLYGRPGGYQTKLSSNTKGKPCPVCGDSICREAYLGGNIYYCPTCQKFDRETMA